MVSFLSMLYPILCMGGGGVFSICYVWSLTHCHGWNSLPCIHQQFSIIASCNRPPATTISIYSYTSSPGKKKTSSNRLGTPLSQKKPEGPLPLQPTTELPNIDKEMVKLITNFYLIRNNNPFYHHHYISFLEEDFSLTRDIIPFQIDALLSLCNSKYSL